MPTFPIYVGFSQFEVVEKANPDIPIGIVKIPKNPAFLKTALILQEVTPNFQPK
jgi:hypothetical protein